MNKLQSGEVYTAEKAISGKSKTGNWELLLTRDPSGKNDIGIFVKNVPSAVKEGDVFRINEITGVSNGFRKGKDNKWKQWVSIDAEITKVNI